MLLHDMNAPHSNVKACVKRIAKLYVEEYLDDEACFFDEVWGAFDEWSDRFEARSVSPAIWKELSAHLKDGLGFAEAQGLDLVTPKVLATVYSSVVDAATMPQQLSHQYVSHAVKTYGKRYGVPTRLLPQLAELVIALVAEDFRLTGVFPVGDPGLGYVAVLGSDNTALNGTWEELASQIEAIRSKKAEMDLFVDDLAHEFLIRHGESLKLSPYEKRLLILLLQRVGAYWDYASLFSKLWGDEMARADNFYVLMNRLHEATDHILSSFVNLPRGEERCYVKEDIRRCLTYVVIFAPGAY